jgi:hypothetical protein
VSVRTAKTLRSPCRKSIFTERHIMDASSANKHIYYTEDRKKQNEAQKTGIRHIYGHT